MIAIATYPTVTIEHWQHDCYGERWSIANDDGRTILTFGSEIEARQRCRDYGWVVTRTDAGEMFRQGDADGA